MQRQRKIGKRPTLDGDESPDGEFNPFKEGPKPIGKKKGKNPQSGSEIPPFANTQEKKESVIKSEEDGKKEEEVKKEKEADKPIRSSLPWAEPTANQPMKEAKAEEQISKMQTEQPAVVLPVHIEQNQHHLPPLPPPEVTASEANSEKLNPNKGKKIAKERNK